MQCPGGISIVIFDRYSEFEDWYKKMLVELKAYMKKRNASLEKSLPTLPKKSMSDSVAEMRGKASFYQKRGEALQVFFNTLV